GMWHRYTGLQSLQHVPVTPQQSPEDSDAGKAAFAYSQSGLRYTFFARLRGHFFEMTRDDEWAPTMRPAIPRLVWCPAPVPRDALLAVMHRDVEKILTGMVELFGLRVFCHGFFDGISGRVSEGSGNGSSRRRHPSVTSSRMRRSRVSAGAISSLGTTAGHASPYRRPQSMNLSSSLSAAAAAATAAAAAAAAVASGNSAGTTGSSTATAARSLSHQHSRGSLGAGLFGQAKNSSGSGNIAAPFASTLAAARQQQQQGMALLSPQPRSFNSFPSSVDIATMSASLPNSPFFGLHLDNVAAQQPHHTPLLLQGQNNSVVGSGTSHDGVQLFPSLNDAAFLTASSTTPSIGLLQDPVLAASADAYSDNGVVAATTAAAAAAAVAATASIDAGSLFAGSAVSGSPAFWDLSSTGLQHQMQQASLSTPVAGTMSAIRSPNANAAVAAAAVAAAMGMNSINTTGAAGLGGIAAGSISGPSSASSTSTTTSASVAIYPQQAGHQTAMPIWDEMAAQTLTNVLGSPDMLMQFAQPSPTPTVSHYNLSAHPTPAFDTCSAPPLSGQFGTLAASSLATAAVPIASMAMGSNGSSDVVMTTEEGKFASSSIQAYFGTPGSDYNAGTSP
ncbi:hypothetical protein LPJ57_008834, partial [Coemansia sp. RSA 486]